MYRLKKLPVTNYQILSCIGDGATVDHLGLMLRRERSEIDHKLKRLMAPIDDYGPLVYTKGDVYHKTEDGDLFIATVANCSRRLTKHPDKERMFKEEVLTGMTSKGKETTIKNGSLPGK